MKKTTKKTAAKKNVKMTVQALEAMIKTYAKARGLDYSDAHAALLTIGYNRVKALATYSLQATN